MWGRDVHAEDLVEVLQCEQPRLSPVQLPGFESSPLAWNRGKLRLDCDEVWPDVFIGDA